MAVDVSIEGQQARVDATGARLVSQLRGSKGSPWLTVRTGDGESVHQAVPEAARQGTFKLGDKLTVDATSASDFVAVTQEDGRALVVAYGGEVVVKPAGDGGERFALAPNEALVVPAGGGEVRVVSTTALTDADQAELGSLVDAATDAVLAAPVAAVAAAEPEPTQPVEKVKPEPEPEKVEPEPTKAAAPVVAAEKKAPATQPARSVTKKGKKQKKRAPAKTAVGAAAVGAAAASKTASRPPAKATGSAGKPPRTPPPPAHEGDGELESDPKARRAIVVVVGLVALMVAVFLLTSGGDGDEPSDVASGPGTTAESSETTETPDTTEGEEPATTAAAPTTTAAAPTTTARPATTTTAAPTTTTTVRATTTTAAAAPVYAVAPRSCVQSGNTITYTAGITNQSARAYDYVVSVVFNDKAGKQVAAAEARVDDLAPNRTTEFSATGRSTQDLANSGATCVVQKIDATPA